MSFFHKKNVTKCLGHHYAIWTSDSNFLLAQIFFVSIPYIGPVFTSYENIWHHFTDSKSCQIIESILKYKNGF